MWGLMTKIGSFGWLMVPIFLCSIFSLLFFRNCIKRELLFVFIVEVYKVIYKVVNRF